MDSVFVLIVAIYLAVNIYATANTVKTSGHTNTRKLYQLLAIWCLPFLGGLTVSLMYMINSTSDGRRYDVGVGAGEHGDSGGE